MITYGIHIFADKLAATSLHLLDTAKSRFIKRILQLPMTASTVRSHTLAGCLRLSQDLADKNYPFSPDAWSKYRADCENEELKADPLNSADLTLCRQPNQPRHFTAGFAVHGFHHRICKNTRYHERDQRCVCRFCHQTANRLDHLAHCPHMSNKTMYDRYIRAMSE